jgi:uncharacterized membrane protein
MRKNEIAVLTVILFSLVLGVYFYPQLPEMMASHWNATGEVDGYTSKFWGLFLMPLISLALFLFFITIPKIDPLKKNIVKFKEYFDWFVFLIILFLFYIDALTIFYGLGYRFNLVLYLVPAFGVLFYYCGILIEHSKRNWFIGIRTPWTLASDKVWNKTHKLGGILLKICGVFALLGFFLEDSAIYFVIVPPILASVYLFVYSYFEYQKKRK